MFLAWILKSCLDEYKDSDIETIESYIEDTPQVGEVPVGEDATNRARPAGETVAGRSTIGGPKGWSGEHTKRSAVRSHGTPAQASAQGGAQSEAEGLEWRAHEAKRSAQPRNTAQASAQGGAKNMQL